MDPLAHSLFGAALARTRLGRDAQGAVLTLVVAANLPDIDVFSYAAGSDAALGFRRGLTHGPLGLVLLPLAWWALLCAFHRWRGDTQRTPLRRGRLLVLAYLGALSHPALDWLNTYGVRFLMPWSERWYYGDVLFIVDPWIWLVLGAAAFLAQETGPRALRSWTVLGLGATLLVVLLIPPALWPAKLLWCLLIAALVGVRISGLAREPRRRELLSAGLVALSLLYVGAMVWSARAAKQSVLDWLQADGTAPPARLMVGPLPLTPLTRDVVVETADGYRFGRFDWTARPRLELAGRLPKPVAGEVVERALADPCVRGFMNWARFLVVEVEEGNDAFDVYLLDARYTRTRTRGFGGTHVRIER